MIRELTGHKVNEVNDNVQIVVADPKGAGGAHHRYEVTVPGISTAVISFQKGPIGEAGVNGITQEALIAICIDRLECFQAGEFACVENALALNRLKEAMTALHSRTKARMDRGVEGTHKI